MKGNENGECKFLVSNWKAKVINILFCIGNSVDYEQTWRKIRFKVRYNRGYLKFFVLVYARAGIYK